MPGAAGVAAVTTEERVATATEWYNLISADSHVVEPPDIFETRLPAALRDRAPRLAPIGGGSAWIVDGSEPVPLPATTSTGTGWHRAADGREPTGPVTWDAVLPALYDPAERVKSQWADSIDAEILYPTPELVGCHPSSSTT